MTYDPKQFARLVELTSKKLDPTQDFSILDNPVLSHAFFELVPSALGPDVTKITLTAWAHGSRHVEGGSTAEKTWEELGTDLQEMSLAIIPKANQPYFIQGVSPSGKRNNASVSEMTVLALDCDDRGGWEKLQETLDVLGLAYILYHSSGYREGGPNKWRAVMPLATPFDVSTPELRHSWKHVYRCIRALFGHAAGLAYEGFDPSLATPSQPVYVGCRRNEDTPPRVVIWKKGKTFDANTFGKRIPDPPPYVPAAETSEEWPELAHYFAAAGWLGEQRGNKICVRCPWNGDHSEPLRPDDEPTDKAVVYFPKEGSTAGIFTCFSHGTKTITEIKAILPAEVVAIADALCVTSRLKELQEARRTSGEVLPEYPVLPDKELVHKWDEIGNAHRFARDFGHLCRYDKDRGHWLVYDGKRWAIDKSDSLVQCHAVASVKKMYRDLEAMDEPDLKKLFKKFITVSSSYRSVTNLLRLARTVPGMSVGADVWDRDLYMLNVDNGTLNLKTGELHAHSSADLLTKLCPVPYEKEGASPAWEGFLRRIIPSLEIRQYLARVCGYTATGVTSEHCMHVLHGNGSNGKSTMVSMLGYVLGDYFSSTDASTFLAQRSDAPRNDLAALVGARMVSASETEVGRNLSEATVKVCTGGDSVTCRFLHKEFFSYVPQYKVFLMSNSKPLIKGADEGIWRRMRLVPFEVSIPESEQDQKLKDRLKAEAAGILSWIVTGCLEWQKAGLQPPEEIRAATRAYREEMDPITDWLEESCLVDVADENMQTLTTILFDSYKAYVFLKNEEPVDKDSFYGFLHAHGIKSKNKKVGQKVLKVRLGISLKVGRFSTPPPVGPS